MVSGRGRFGFGVFHQAWAYAECSDATALDRIGASTELAEELGCFDIAWFTEQHDRTLGGFWGRVGAPHLLMAHLAARTERIGLGAGVRLIGDLDPRRVAEEAVTLELLAGAGRIHLGIGAGMGRSADPGEREHRRLRARHHARRLAQYLRAESTDLADQIAVDMSVPDLADRLYVASTDDRSLDQAARLGQGYLLGMFGGPRHADMARRFRERGGRGPVRAVRMVYVAPSDAHAMNQVGAAAQRLWSSFIPPSAGWRASKQELGTSVPTQVILDQLGWIVGSAETVAEQIEQYAGECELDGIDLAFQVPGLPEPSAREAMRLFATEVVPLVRDAHVSGNGSTPARPEAEPTPIAIGAPS